MLQLYINSLPADIKEESIIAITKTYESVHNPLLYYADYSKTIKLPVSAQNNAIFSNFNRLDSTVTNLSIDPAKKVPAFILNNQEKVLEGYVQLNNANTIYTDEAYEVTFYSTLGLIMNELKLLTFNKEAVDVDPKYIIDSPLSDDLKIDRNLVKQSFEQQTHLLTGNNAIDWFGFIPTYQGKYSDFDSDRVQVLPSGRVDDMSRERDEHYTREFRSYYQQPFIWVDKLWKVAKDKIDSITDYTLNLDSSWFTGSNPYYKDLIYTCPSLFTSDDNFRQATERFEDTLNILMFNKASKNPSLSSHVTYPVNSLVSINNAGIYDSSTGIFNSNATFGSSKLKGRLKCTLFASIPGHPGDGYWYCKITDDNPFYVKIKAVNANTGMDIYGAKKTFLLYSDDYDVNSHSFDKGVDLGVCNISHTGVAGGIRPLINHTGFQHGNHAWDCKLDFELNITENVPYRLCVEVWNANNGDPFEYTDIFSGVYWDWLWGDDFNTSYGQDNDKGYSMYFDSINIACETTENLRTGSNISLYKIFPKDITLCDVILNYSKMFGLVWDVNEFEKTINVMTRNRFFSDYRILDWTDKVDRSKEFKFAPLTFDKKYVEFNFEEGDCGRLKNYESTYQLTYGSKKLDTGYDFNSETNELMENLKPSVICQKRQYSKMMNTEYDDRPNFMGFSYMVYPNERYVDNDDEGKNAGMFGAFYFRNGTFEPDENLSNWDENGRYCVTVSDDTQHMIQKQEFCWNMCGEGMVPCYYLPDVSTISKQYEDQRYSVHFEAPKEYYFDTPDGTINYVYHSFWENYINERYCSQNKKLTAYVYITIDEFKDIDFREFIKIDNILYHIDKIYDFNYNSDAPVKMDLVQVWDLSAYTHGQDDVPYLFTIPQSVDLTTSNQTVPVYSTYENYHIASKPSWVTASIDANGDLTVRANDAASEYRNGNIVLLKGATVENSDFYNMLNGWFVSVQQYPTNPYRLDVDRNTLVFDFLGGTQTVTIDCHNTSNNAISISNSNRWITATIREYKQTIFQTRRDCLHLDVTVQPRTATTPRNGTLTLSITANGTTYTQTINVGQQGGLKHTRDDNYRLITDVDSDLEVLDINGNVVNTLVSGQIYHFVDLFPEEIDIDSIQITGGGSVNIAGNSGLQTVTFMPQLSNGDEVGGGLITIATMNGNIVSYAYDVEASGGTPTPEARHIVVSSDENAMFRIETTPSVMAPKTVNYFEDDIVDGTVITLTALPNNGYTLDRWIDQDSTIYLNPVVTKTVSSSIVDGNNTFTIKLESKKTQVTYDVFISAGDSGYITVGNDPTQYTTYTKTVLEGTVISDVKITPDAGYTFAQWDDGSILNPRNFTVYSDVSVKAIYVGGGDSNINIDGGGLLGADDYISLALDGDEVALAGIGEYKTVNVPNGTYAFKLYCHINDMRSRFMEWDINGTHELSNPYTNNSMIINQDKTIKVICAPNTNYSVSVSAGNNGSVSVNGVTGNYSQSVQQGTVLSLVAIPNTNYQFNGWSDGNNNNPRSLTVAGNTTLTASFTPIMRTVNISAGNDGSVSVNGVSGYYSQTVQQGTVLTLVATPANRYKFSGWSDGNNSNPRNLTVTGNTTLTASFEADLENTYFYIEDISGNGSVVSMAINTDLDKHVYYSTDQTNWTDMGVIGTTTITATIPVDKKVYFKSELDNWGYYTDYNVPTIINVSDKYNVGGNSMSLLYGDNFSGMTSLTTQYDNLFSNMFNRETNLVNAKDLILPAIRLTRGCYQNMFAYCTSLITAPELPAKKLEYNCYTQMFRGCTSLTTAPELLVTTLAQSCYSSMFRDCTALTIAPALPATTLAQSCYNTMFRGCTSLTTAPALPATTMYDSCYSGMFNGCTSLTTAPALPATTLTYFCYQSMFTNCTSLVNAPVLPATTLAQSCYNQMFSGCTSLTQAPALPATTLTLWCYGSMFRGCTSLKEVTTYADDISASNCLNNWLQNVAATGEFYNLGSATYPSGASGIPSGWTEHNSL